MGTSLFQQMLLPGMRCLIVIITSFSSGTMWNLVLA